MGKADHAVFGPEAKGMCIHCHHIEQRDGKWHVPLVDPTLTSVSTSKEVQASKYIGHLVMEALREVDQVAYVRFASVYREFKDVNQFLDELKPLLGRVGPVAGREGQGEAQS
jgi:transcriptional regulator NrdR family protein